MTERTYSEDEIRTLLKRSAELQRMQRPDRAPGLTQAEIEEIAAESGIPPEFVRAAVRESATGVKSRNVSGHTDTHVFIERVVPGELTEHKWEEVVVQLRRKYGRGIAMGSAAQRLGTIEQLGNMRSWHHSTPAGVTTEFSIRSIDGMQHVHFERRVGMGSPRAEGIGYGGLVALVSAMISGAATESVWILILVFVAALAIAAPTVEYLDRRWRAGILRDMGAITDDVVRVLADPGKEGTPVAEDPDPAVRGGSDRMSLDLEDASEEPGSTEQRQRSRS